MFESPVLIFCAAQIDPPAEIEQNSNNPLQKESKQQKYSIQLIYSNTGQSSPTLTATLKIS